MSYLGYNVNNDARLPDYAGALSTGLQTGMQLNKGLLDLQQQRKFANLQDQYGAATDEATKKGLLQQLAVYNPEHAKGLLSASNYALMPFGGESFKSQGANIHYQALKSRFPDMPEGILRAKAYNAALSGENIDLGNKQPAGTLTPLPPVGSQLGDNPSDAEKVVAKLPPVADHASNATPEEIQFAKDFVAQPVETQGDWYTKNASAHPDLPKELTPEVKGALYEAADHFATNTPTTKALPTQSQDNLGQDAQGAVNPDIESLASAMIAGREPYPSGMAMRARPELKDALRLARRKDPNYDFATAAGRLKNYKDMTSGKSADELEALNTALGHYSTLMDKWKKLDNGSIPIVNAVANKISGAMGNPEVSGFKQTADLLAPELIKAYRASHSQAETDKFQNNFDINASNEQQKEILKTGAELMQSKIAAKMSRYKKANGTVEGFSDLAGIDQAGIHTLNKLGVDTTKLGLPAAQNDIPSAAMQHLKDNPALAVRFDEKYGAGAAKKVLGK